MLTGAPDRRRLLLAFVLLWAGFSAVYFTALVSGGWLGLPPVPGDGQDYDNIAIQIAHGRGFATKFDDEWRAPYVRANGKHVYDQIIDWRTPLRLTTYRPPLLPLLLAGMYRAFGRQFVSWQIFSCLFVGLGLALVCVAAKRAAGWPALMCAAVLAIATDSYFNYTGPHGLLTEPLGVALISVLLFAFSIADERPLLAAVLCGVDVAALGLSRNFFIPMVVPIPLLFAALVWRNGVARRVAITAGAIVLVLGIALQAPWWIRNVRLLHAPLPFGTQSGLAVFAGFSDGAVAHHGIFWGATDEEIGTMYSNLGVTCVPCNDVELARSSWRGALLWIRANPEKSVWLGWQKILDTCRHGSEEVGTVAWFYLLAIPAPLIARRRSRPVVIAAWMVAALMLATIAATWSAGWRYFVPAEPLLGFLTATVLGKLFSLALAKRSGETPVQLEG